MTSYFLLAMGSYNLLGSAVLYAMLNSRIADLVMRRWASIFVDVYDIGRYGSLWLWWAATANVFYSVINIIAADWELTVQRTIIWSDLFMYSVFLALAIAALGNPHYGKGNSINILLFTGWLLWAACCLLMS